MVPRQSWGLPWGNYQSSGDAFGNKMQRQRGR
jgi:hypothetical protein